VVSVTDPYGRILGVSRPAPLICLLSSSSVVLTRLSGPLSTHLRKSGSSGNRIRPSGSVARIWPLNHRGGLLLLVPEVNDGGAVHSLPYVTSWLSA
jgi:hypothetical protein